MGKRRGLQAEKNYVYRIVNPHGRLRVGVKGVFTSIKPSKSLILPLALGVCMRRRIESAEKYPKTVQKLKSTKKPNIILGLTFSSIDMEN